MDKNANGKNKLARQKNKAKKYLNIDLKDYSNTYWQITEFDKSNTFILFTNYRIVKNGELAIIEPLNRIKEYFKKSFSVIYEEKPYYYNSFIIFQSYGDKQQEELIELCRGYDDIWLLEDWILKNQHTPNKMLIKKVTSGFVNANGEFFKTRAKEIEARNKDNEIEEFLEEIE